MQIYESPEAMGEYSKWQHLLQEDQREKLLHATLSRDGDEWCIFSGSELTLDRAGFGSSIAAAVQDYVSAYTSAKRA